MSKNRTSILSSLLIIASFLTGCSPQHSEPDPKNLPIQLQPTPGTPYQASENPTADQQPRLSPNGL